ncbi:N-6 DNA methylase, partial [Nitrosomonas sp.]|uniref:N-6 DNA methylase n=1 Tax=Nitrosomonas sp. TaxID=42353 RepID=UPI002730750D
IRLIDHYFAAGMERLIENNEKIEPVCAQLLDVLDDAGGKQAVAELLQHWVELDKLKAYHQQYIQQNGSVIPSACEESYAQYKISPSSRNDNRGGRNDSRGDRDNDTVIPNASEESSINTKNQAQHQLRSAFDPFFSALHEGLKRLDKTVRQHEKQQTEQAQKEGKRTSTDRRTKALKTALEELHQDVKNAEIYFQHIHWLQERFPNAQYEDVTGLCKLATPEEIKEQDYSLNPGRYVGVVIEEDGKSEEEFIAELLAMNDELSSLNNAARELEVTIIHNILRVTGDQ